MNIKNLCFLLVWASSFAQAQDWSAKPLAEVVIYPEFRAIATVKPVNEARIAAEVGGRIEAVPPRAGERVSQGAELVRIDPGDYRIAVDRAAAQADLMDSRIRLAEAQLGQARALAGRGFISEDALRVRETELAVLSSEREAARHALAAAKRQLSKTVIRAPFDGIVRERLVSVGDYAQTATPLLVLMSVAETEIHARIPVAQVDDLKRAPAVRLWIDETEHALTLVRVVEAVESAGQAQVAVLRSSSNIAPGLAGEMRWQASAAHLPAELIVSVGGQLGVWLDADGKPVFRPLAGAVAGRAAPAAALGDVRVIVDGRHGLGVEAAPAHEVAQ